MTKPELKADAEPVAWEHLKVYGYAPGNYSGHCRTCGNEWIAQDKRSWLCRECAEKKHAQFSSILHPAPAPAAQADKADAEPVEKTAYLWWCAKCAREVPYGEPDGEVSLSPDTHTVCGNPLELVKRHPAPAPADQPLPCAGGNCLTPNHCDLAGCRESMKRSRAEYAADEPAPADQGGVHDVAELIDELPILMQYSGDISGYPQRRLEEAATALATLRSKLNEEREEKDLAQSMVCNLLNDYAQQAERIKELEGKLSLDWANNEVANRNRRIANLEAQLAEAVGLFEVIAAKDGYVNSVLFGDKCKVFIEKARK